MAYDSGSGKTIIRFNKLLNFQVKGEGKEMKTTDWLMHEFSVTEKCSDLVLFVIYKKNKKEEERGLALAWLWKDHPLLLILGFWVLQRVFLIRWISLMTRAWGQDPYDDQDPFDESPRFAAIDGHSQFQVLDSQEDGLTKKMGSEVEGFDGFDEVEVEGLLLDLADDTEPDFDPLSFLNLLDSEEDARPSKKMRCDFSDIE